jgi:4-carboxymuconolactone decarboxylase
VTDSYDAGMRPGGETPIDTYDAGMRPGGETPIDTYDSGMRPGGETPIDTYDAGMTVRREVLGDEHVDRAVANTTEFTEKFQDYITRSVWGSIWTREGLDRKTRSCITLAVLTALHCHGEIAMHVRAAIGNGLTADEIGEVLLHTGAYAGVPAANAAFAIAQRTLADLGEASDPPR